MEDNIENILIADVEVRRQSTEWKRVLSELEMALEEQQNNPECGSKDALGNIRTAIRKVIDKAD